MGFFDALDVSASALTAERLRMDVAAENLANAQTTGANGQAYRRKEVVVRPQGDQFSNVLAGAMSGGQRSARSAGVEVVAIQESDGPQRRVHDPGHPDADAEGYVTLPDVQPVNEMVDLITASRAYEANVTAMNTAKQMLNKTLDILR